MNFPGTYPVADPHAFTELSHQEHRQEEADRLIGLARQIRTWQDVQRPKVSDAQMIRTFPGLGSDKTYRKIREGDLETLNVERQIAAYRGVWAEIEAMAGAAADEDIYDDLQPALDTGAAVAGLIPQRGMTRLVVIVGPSGSGKSKSAQLAARKYPGAVVMTEAHEGWTSLNCALADLLHAVHAVKASADLPLTTGERLDKLINHLRGSRRVIWIDEGHHATAQVLNAIKTIINRTDSLIVISCIDTLWRKLAARSWEETKQLFFNRLYLLVKLAPPSREDAIAFLARRCPNLGTGKGWHDAAAKVAAMAATCGRFAFLRQVATRLNELDGDGSDLVQVAAQLKSSLEIR